MDKKIVNKKQRFKSAALNNIPITNKNNKINKNNKVNKNNQLNSKRALSDLNNEKKESKKKTLSDKKNEKVYYINYNNKTNNYKNLINGSNRPGTRSKSLNLIQKIIKKDNPINNKNKHIINVNNVNINHVNNNKNLTNNKKIENNFNKPKNKSMNKIINNKNIIQNKPVSSYNAFKTKSKSNNKISKTEDKNINKNNQQKNQIPKNNLFVKFFPKEKKINSSYANKANIKHPISAKIVNKNTKNTKGKLPQQKPKTINKKNQSIESNKIKTKQVTNNNNNNGYIQQKKIAMELFNKKILSAKKREKENKNKNNNINNKKQKEIKNKKDKENKDKDIPVKINIIKTYIKPTLIGLNNIGATCYINSTLQCLSQTEGLTNYFLNEKNKDKIINNNIALENKNENQLSPYYLELINNLWDKNDPNKKSFSPDNFIKIINEMNPLFKRGDPGDSKDFIIFILEQIHKELKKPMNTKLNVPELNQYDKVNTFQNFFNEFQLECSIISDLFFGINETTNVCLNCKKEYNLKNLNEPISYNYGIFNCIIFPLEQVRKMKLQNNQVQANNQMMMNSNNIVDIYDCFQYNQKSDLFTDDNKYYCNICNQLYDSIFTSRIYISPNILILILNRGKGNKYNIKLDFPEIIDITQFVIKKEIPEIKYNLYGVVTHLGESGPNAHFVASCKSPVSDKWYRYNDAMVNPINDIQKEVFDFGTPYILFYQKNKK